MYKRQSAQANTKRSNGYKLTASVAKTNGHKKEHLFTTTHGGSVVPTGQKETVIEANGFKTERKVKTDVRHPNYGNVTVKAPAGGKVQMQLQVSDEVEKKWGSTNPLTLATKAQRAYYEDRHFNNEDNAKALYSEAKKEVAKLATWLNEPGNFRDVLVYSLGNDGEVAYMADMYNTDSNAYMTPLNDFIDGIIAAEPRAYVTESGLRVAVEVFCGQYRKDGRKKFMTAFSFEVRSDKDKCKSLLYKMEGKYIFPLIRKTVGSCSKI